MAKYEVFPPEEKGGVWNIVKMVQVASNVFKMPVYAFGYIVDTATTGLEAWAKASKLNGEQTDG